MSIKYTNAFFLSIGYAFLYRMHTIKAFMNVELRIFELNNYQICDEYNILFIFLFTLCELYINDLLILILYHIFY